jgi:hypothetical protein
MCDINSLDKTIENLFPTNKLYFINNYTGKLNLKIDDSNNVSFQPNTSGDFPLAYYTFFLDENYKLRRGTTTTSKILYLYVSPDFCYGFFSFNDIPNQIKADTFYLSLGGNFLTVINNKLYKIFVNDQGSIQVSDNCNVEKDKLFLFGPPPQDIYGYEVYCASHDSTASDPTTNLLGKPMYTNNYCINSIYNQPDYTQKLFEIKNNYCKSYPLLHDCPSYCAPMLDNTGKIVDKPCTATLDSFCVGDNIKFRACRNYVSNKYVNKDDEIKKYCSQLTDPLKEDLELCGCFMPTDYYKNFMKSIESDDIKVDYDISQQYCYFGPCAASTIKPYYYKTENPNCPDINACVTYSFQNINVNGQVDPSDIIIIKNDCCNISTNLSSKSCSSSIKTNEYNNIREYYGNGSCKSTNYFFIVIGIILMVLLLILFTKKK